MATGTENQPNPKSSTTRPATLSSTCRMRMAAQHILHSRLNTTSAANSSSKKGRTALQLSTASGGLMT
jgi:hypothetical protein